MNKAEKNQMIDLLADKLANNAHFYLTDISEMTVENSNKLRGALYEHGIQIEVVKNTLLQKAMEKVEGRDYSDLYSTLKGGTSILFTEVGNLPAKVIKDFRKKGSAKPILKAAFVEECAYIGDNQLDALATIKSKDELVADIIAALQSPAKNVIGALQSGGQKLSGILQTLSERS